MASLGPVRAKSYLTGFGGWEKRSRIAQVEKWAPKIAKYLTLGIYVVYNGVYDSLEVYSNRETQVTKAITTILLKTGTMSLVHGT